MGSLYAPKIFLAFKSLELPNAAERIFSRYYHYIISCWGMFRGVESVPNFFVGSLYTKIFPALKTLDMQNAVERIFIPLLPLYNMLGRMLKKYFEV